MATRSRRNAPSPAPTISGASDPALPDLAQIRAAAERIRGRVHRTPVLTASSLDRLAGGRLFFKCEAFQRGGAFKARGATHAVRSLPAAEARHGVVTHSSGNHGAALALAAADAGIPARVVMPEGATAVKRAAVEAYGAEVVTCPPTPEGRQGTAERIAAATGAALIHPYDDPRVIAGQGTVALELVEQVADLEAVIAPVGGGGLISGIALALAELAPAVEVIGAEPALADDAARSLAAGERLAPGPPRTIADGLRSGLCDRTFAVLRSRVARVVTVEEEAIVAAMRTVWERLKVVIEPSAAVPVAAALAGEAAGRRVAVILSGGNVDLEGFFRGGLFQPPSPRE